MRPYVRRNKTHHAEDALYEIESMRRFAGLRLSERLPDETTILNFRHFLEAHKLGKLLFERENRSENSVVQTFPRSGV